jgi:beta-mannosidase
MSGRLNTSTSLLQQSSLIIVWSIFASYGWDWGPVLMTVGPWRPIYLHTYTDRITDFRARTDVSETLSANITVQLETTLKQGSAAISITNSVGAVVREGQAKVADGKAEISFTGKAGEFELWWPVGYGKQPLYTVSAILHNGVSHRFKL